MGATVLVAVLGSLVLSLLMALGLAVGYGVGMGDWDRLVAQVGGQVSYLPGVLLVAAVAVAIGGLVPRWSLFAWAGVALVFFQVMLGEALRLPDWVSATSPFWHLSRVPVEAFDPLPALAELALAVLLVLVGVRGFRHRDVAAG